MATLEGHWALNQSSGTDVPDTSSNTNNGTIQGTGYSWVGGIINNGLTLPGLSTDYVLIPFISQYELSSLSVIAWVKTNVVNTFVIARYGGTGKYVWTLQSGATGEAKFGAWTSTDTGTSISGTDIDDGNWHLVVGVIDGLDMKLYIDNHKTPVATGVLPAAVNTVSGEPISLGVKLHGSPCALNGVLDDVRIYDGALTEQEILDLYYMGFPTYGISDFLIRVAAGDGINIKSADGKDYNIDMGDKALKINGTDQEIGNYFSKKQIANAYHLREAIINGLVECSSGSNALV